MEELIIDKKKAIKYLIIIILILIGIRVYFGYQKEDFFMDETFSYTLMNMKEGAGMVQTAPEFNNTWISGDKIKNMLTVSNDEILRYDTNARCSPTTILFFTSYSKCFKFWEFY